VASDQDTAVPTNCDEFASPHGKPPCRRHRASLDYHRKPVLRVAAKPGARLPKSAQKRTLRNAAPMFAFPESGQSSAQRFDQAPKFDSGLGSGTVAAIAVSFALRRTASRAVEATNGPAVQRLTWASPHHRKFSFFGISRLESAGLCIDFARKPDQVAVIFDEHLLRFTPLFMALREGVSGRITSCGFLFACSTERQDLPRLCCGR
jgi:hypothetical protein